MLDSGGSTPIVGMRTVEKTDYEKLRIFMDLLHSEQNFFWQRFSAFATLHAALFVLTTATQIANHTWASALVVTLSIALAVAWIAVQSVSLKYADRWKPAFHSEREALGIKSEIPTNRLYSSTDLAWWVPIGVLLLWLVVLATLLIG